MKILEAEGKDLKEIVNIFIIGSKKRPYLQKWTKKKATDMFKLSLKKKELWIAVLDKKVIGFIFAGVSSANKKIVYVDRKSTRLNSSHTDISRMPSSA